MKSLAQRRPCSGSRTVRESCADAHHGPVLERRHGEVFRQRSEVEVKSEPETEAPFPIVLISEDRPEKVLIEPAPKPVLGDDG